MERKKTEIRTLDCKLSIREAAPDAPGESRTITGTAIVFDVESEVLDDWGYRFREVIKPEACTMEFLNTQDIKMNLLHDRDLTVARCNKGVGSLRLSVDEKGVNFEFEAPNCDLGDRCLEMVRRGDYSGCSFEFWPQDYDVEEREGGKDVKITHKRFQAISALTIGMDPAYKQTSVNARELLTKGTEGTEETEDTEAKLAQEKEKALEREREISAAMRRRREREVEKWSELY